MKKIFVCGGHISPALAVIESLSHTDNIEIVFVGRKFALEGVDHVSAEYTLIRDQGIRFLPLTTGRLQRSFTIQTIPSLFKIPVGFLQAFVYCLKERPNIIVSFGGYVALPVALAAWALGIPVITHEQTLAPGLTNRIIARIAGRVCVAFDEASKYFPKGKTIVTGLPMREEIFTSVRKPEYTMDEHTFPIVYITGGSQGARSLNNRLYPAIARLLRSYTIIHQTGSLSQDEALSYRRTLPDVLQKRYHIEPFISAPNIGWILKNAMFVIGRSGANTTVELAALGKVVILVPLPWSAGNEQLLQAKWLADHGAAVIIPQDTITGDILARHILKMRSTYRVLQKRAEKFSGTIARDGAKRFTLEIQKLLTALT